LWRANCASKACGASGSSALRAGAAELVSLFGDRSDGLESVSRLPVDGTGVTSNACLVAEPTARRVRACRGLATRGRWLTFAFPPALAALLLLALLALLPPAAALHPDRRRPLISEALDEMRTRAAGVGVPEEGQWAEGDGGARKGGRDDGDL